LGTADSVKIILTATEDGKGKQPHQAFLLLKDPETGLEATFPFSVKDTGKAKVDFVCALSQFPPSERS
jgi:oligosaccharyltransferase complex subunit delta (ribophorin II)